MIDVPMGTLRSHAPRCQGHYSAHLTIGNSRAASTEATRGKRWGAGAGHRMLARKVSTPRRVPAGLA
jgi:hypothetical protein